MTRPLKLVAFDVMDVTRKLYNEMDELPPNAVLFSPSGMAHLFFTEMATIKDKENIAMTIIVLAHYLGSVTSIAFNSESWMLRVSKEDTPELWEKYKGDGKKIHDHIIEQYGSVGNSPYKVEALVTSMDDGEKTATLMSMISRKGEKPKLEPVDDSFQETKVGHDYNERFMSLLAKSKKLSSAIDLMMQMGKMMFPDKVEADYLKELLKLFARDYRLNIDIDKVLKDSLYIAEKIKAGETKHTLH